MGLFSSNAESFISHRDSGWDKQIFEEYCNFLRYNNLLKTVEVG